MLANYKFWYLSKLSKLQRNYFQIKKTTKKNFQKMQKSFLLPKNLYKSRKDLIDTKEIPLKTLPNLLYRFETFDTNTKSIRIGLA